MQFRQMMPLGGCCRVTPQFTVSGLSHLARVSSSLPSTSRVSLIHVPKKPRFWCFQQVKSYKKTRVVCGFLAVSSNRRKWVEALLADNK